MNVIIQIKGREAIPVRALPWLTNWEFSACAVADAFPNITTRGPMGFKPIVWTMMRFRQFQGGNGATR